MFYVIVCPGMPFKGDTIKEGKSLGGSESAAYYLAREIASRGHKVTLFTSHPEAAGRTDGVDYAYCGPQSVEHPIGIAVDSFLANAECDVLIMQRATGILKVPHCAKTAFLWLHDLALVRQVPPFRADSFMYDKVFAVSEWHKRQISETWGVHRDSIHVVHNGVDRELYLGPDTKPETKKRFELFYQSRFERGIDYLIAPGAIMDQLAKARPDAHLYVCGYENEPEHMRAYYNNVRERIKQMPNATLLGYMGKKQLADVQRSMDVLVYPSNFEETSCITAMEAQCAGLPMVGCAVGALPETCEGSGTKLLPLKDGKPDVEAFVKYIASLKPEKLDSMSRKQLNVSANVGWSRAADDVTAMVEHTFLEKRQNKFSIVRTMLDRSDIVAAKTAIDAAMPEYAELIGHYAFADTRESLAKHYDEDHSLSALDEDKNLDVTQNGRFQFVFEELKLGKPSNVLDYGCQKGHYIFSCIRAGLNDGVRYTGMDVSKRHMDWAGEEFKRLGLDNVRFVHDDAMSPNWHTATMNPVYDALLLCEVIEHVPDPIELCTRLEAVLIDGARVVISTPYGEWEGKDYHDKPDMKRYHLHHFDLSDLNDMFSHNEGFQVIGVPAGAGPHGMLGSYVVAFNYRRDKAPMAKPIDYVRKLAEYSPRETVSLCMIAKDAERTILKTLYSVKDVVDEYVIAIDKNTADNTIGVIRGFMANHARLKRVTVIQDADSPLDIGFDAARNRTVDAAHGDWIMWLDSDEELIHPERLHRYLRHNIFDGYGIAQHHMSADPPGVLTTDWPVRLFRRKPYMRFLGVVHEHPEDMTDLNKGPRSPAQLMDVSIIHHGYTTEEVRRGRFRRNLPLIRRDRKQNPSRTLGLMLWIRDQAHMCMFEHERNQGRVSPQAVEIAHQGLEDWEKLLAGAGDPMTDRMIRDGMEFYSTLARTVGSGFEAQFQFHMGREPGQCDVTKGPRRGAWFLNRKHFDKIMKVCVDEQLSGFNSKYF